MAYEDCAALPAHCAQPMALDESIDSPPALLRAHHDGPGLGIEVVVAALGQPFVDCKA